MTVPPLVRQCVLISAIGVLAGFALNAASPRPAPIGSGVHPASASATAVCAEPIAAPVKHRVMPQQEAILACSTCAVGFVDARGGAAFEQGHVPGAFHLPPEGHAQEDEVFARLRTFATVVVYDDTEGCRLGAGVADRLKSQGFDDVRLLEGSWSDWLAAQGPAQAGSCAACAHGDAP